MRKITDKVITDMVAGLVAKAAFDLRIDVLHALQDAKKREKNRRAVKTLDVITENARVAKRRRVPLCQDTGMTVVYCEVGAGIDLRGLALERAIQNGIKKATRSAGLRHSIVRSPLQRVNTRTNTPGIVHFKSVPGRSIVLKVLLKGFGCENKGAVRLFNPTASREEVVDFIVKSIVDAGANACPPFVVGVGIGGTLDKACELSKEVLFRKITTKNKVVYLAAMERAIEKRVNASGVGPLGFGGKTTALKVLIAQFPTHIAGLPVAVNINCHSLRTAIARVMV
ncbi:MAG: fumarate hydratase [Candidatus Omnitrophica bacterium]|nr:fumarate hydratase [Candidatus Omnitrophota bacterium]